MANATDGIPSSNAKGRLYFTKPDTLRVVALQDPDGHRKLGSRHIPSLVLRGMWMTRVGMLVGCKLAIEWQEDCIILRHLKVPRLH